MSQNTSDKLDYWNESLLKDKLPKQRANRYIVFDTDQGGLNNIRLAFEYVAVLAAVTGRTLVLPPKSPWYLINVGPMPEEFKGGTTEFADLFEIAALRKAIPVITTDEFIDRAKTHLDIPDEFANQQEWDENLKPYNQKWKEWLLDNTEIPGWNPYNTVICLPDIKSAQNGPHLNERYLDSRKQVEFSAWQQAAPVLYFPSNKEYRSLGPVATMFASSDETLPILARRLIKHHIRFRKDIFNITKDILKKLDMGRFDAMQIRRNDFQYSKTRVSTEEVCNNTRKLFDEGLPIYIATDESREEIFEDLKTGLNAANIYRWKDVERVYKKDIPYAWIGPIEQMICSAARRFVGNDLSTFTAYINRLRGYQLAEDTNLYFHSLANDEIKPTLIEDFKGRAYLRENPLFWLSC